MGRTRETLFNWLRPHIGGAHCLDLFAGSGILGFEALSQGAAAVTFVERARAAAAAIANNAELLGGEHMAVITGDARRFLRDCPAFDIVFLDPPFAAPDLLSTALQAISERSLARDFIYVETNAPDRVEAEVAALDLAIDRRAQTGEAHAFLLSGSGVAR